MLGEDKGSSAMPQFLIRIMAGQAALSIQPLFSGYSFQGKKYFLLSVFCCSWPGQYRSLQMLEGEEQDITAQQTVTPLPT
jgi:hypothetical protein